MSERPLLLTQTPTPPGWRRVSIGQVMAPLSRPIDMRADEVYRLVSVRRRFGGLFDREALRGREILTKNLEWLQPGAFLLARMQIVHGACALVGPEMEGAAVSKSYVQLLGQDGTNTAFFAKLAQLPAMVTLYMAASQGVVIEKMTFDLNRWLSFQVDLPPLPEQRKIAEVLDTIDDAIRKTEEVIAKLKKVKQGLLHDLLTRGIDENGELRDPERNPEQFKDSPLGRIPKAWEVQRVKDICNLGRGRVISHGYLADYPGPYPVYSSQSKNDGVFGTIGTYDFEGPHVTWTTDGAYAGTVFFRDGRFNCTNVCGVLKPTGSGLDMAFLALALQPATSRHVSRVGNDKLMNNVMCDIRVPVPPCLEQEAIAEAERAATARERAGWRELEKLRVTKQALMEDLLTGRVRVTPLLDQASE